MKIHLQTRADSALRCPACHDALDAEAPPPAAGPAREPARAPWTQRTLPWLSLGISLAAFGAAWAPPQAPVRARSHRCCQQGAAWTSRTSTPQNLDYGDVDHLPPHLRPIGR